MSAEKVLIDEKPVNKELDAFLKVITKSSNRRKILVRFKFKYVDMEFQEFFTSRQYNAFRTMDCLEFCRTIS
ncbi:MAG: hypothetical protein ACREBI_02755 [Nitrosotalea sp.]